MTHSKEDWNDSNAWAKIRSAAQMRYGARLEMDLSFILPEDPLPPDFLSRVASRWKQVQQQWEAQKGPHFWPPWLSEIPAPTAKLQRQKEWASSRLNLCRLLETSPATSFCWSLSHCRDLTGAIIAHMDSYQPLHGLGLDLAPLDQKISPSVWERIEGVHSSLNPLTLWVLKESALKANTFHPHSTLSEYQVDSIDAQDNALTAVTMRHAPSTLVFTAFAATYSQWKIGLAFLASKP